MRRGVIGAALSAEVVLLVERFVADAAVAEGTAADSLRFAVRSSGTSEDGAAASFAGMYDSVLNVRGVDGICAAIKQVWASQWSEHMISYLQTVAEAPGAAAASAAHSGAAAVSRAVLRGVPVPDMAVVLQVQVPSEVSGVLFTVSPDAAGDPCFVVEGVWGQGEGLVSGEINPETAVVDWAETLTSGAAAVVRRRGEPQMLKYSTSEAGGIELIETCGAERSRSPLDGPLLHRLIAAGLEIAAAKGAPQDIEWCAHAGRLYVVQTRPVTRFAFRRTLGDWGLCLAGSSSLLDETLVADAFRRYVCQRFPLAQAASGNVEAHLRLLGPASADATQPRSLRVPAWEVTPDGLLPPADPLSDSAAERRFASGCAVRAERLWYLDARGMDSGVAAGTLSSVLPAAGDGEAVLLALAGSREEVDAAVEAATACGIGALLVLLCDAAGSSRAASWRLPASAGEGLRVFAMRADAGILDWMAACVAAASEGGGPSACCSLAATLSATLTAHHSRIIHGRLYNSRAVAAPADASGYIPADPSGMLAEIAAVTQAFRERVVPQVDALCRRLLAATVRREARRRAAPAAAGTAPAGGSAAGDAAAPPGSVGPLQLFPSPVRGADVVAALREYRDACSLSWSIAYFISSAEAAFDEAWGSVADVAAAYGATREMLLAGLTSRNTLDELQGLGQRQAGNAALLALCRDETIPDGQLAVEIFMRALAGAKRTSGDSGAAGDAKGTGGGGAGPADREELVFSPSSPLHAVARDLYSFLGHYGWAADNDQDMNERHWAEDAAFPLGVWRKVVLARAATLAAGGAGAPHAAGLEAAAGVPGAPGAPPLLRRESSTASAGRYESASAVLQTELPADHPLWGSLEMLRASLLQKERVHTMYVRLGLRAKLMLQQWIDEHWAALAACGCGGGGSGEAAPAGGWVAREDLNHAPPAYWLAALREGDELKAGDAGVSGGSASSGLGGAGAAAMPPAAAVASGAPAVGPALRTLVFAARIFALERRMWAGTEAIVSLSASRGRTQAVAGGVGHAGAAAGALAGGTATFAGLGCSSGSGAPVVGRARVITKLEQASSVQAGEVLVTRVTSPAWTPLFSLISAVVLEEGGMLSHGAVVARECGLACVSQVRGVVAAIATGDLVQVDGEAGTVTVLERRAA